MKKFAPLAVLLLIGLLYWLKSSQSKLNSPQTSEETAPPTGIQTTAPQATEAKPNTVRDIKDDLSAQFMVNYGKEENPAQHDLNKVADMLESYFVIVKSKKSLPVGENRETTAALIGKNPYRTRFLSPDSPWLNAQGELIDRWNTPLYFHAVSAKQVGVRSAGPDRKMWTSDDLIDDENALPLTK